MSVILLPMEITGVCIVMQMEMSRIPVRPPHCFEITGTLPHVTLPFPPPSTGYVPLELVIQRVNKEAPIVHYC